MASNAGTNILVVDDDIRFLKALSAYLQKMGRSLTLARNGREAQEQIDRNAFDIVITDLKMPGIDGMEVLKKALKKNPRCHVILMTGYGTIETAVEAMKLGAFDYKAKPFLLEEMGLTLERAEENLELLRERERLLEEKEKLINTVKELRERVSALEFSQKGTTSAVPERGPMRVSKEKMMEEASRSYRKWEPPTASWEDGVELLEGLLREGAISSHQFHRLKDRIQRGRHGSNK